MSLLALALVGGPAYAESERGVTPSPELELVAVATGLSRPLLITHAGDGSGRLFIGEQQGRVRVVRDGVLLAQPFLDVDPISSCCGEQGLLGLAFHPDYEATGGRVLRVVDTSPVEVLFADDFETGLTAAWSATVP